MDKFVHHCCLVAPILEYPLSSVAVLDIEFEFHKWYGVGVYLQHNCISTVAVFVVVGHIVLLFAILDTIFLDVVSDCFTEGRIDIGVEAI